MDVFDGMVLIGCALITAGITLLSLPGGLIAGGILMAGAGMLGAAKKGRLTRLAKVESAVRNSGRGGGE